MTVQVTRTTNKDKIQKDQRPSYFDLLTKKKSEGGIAPVLAAKKY